MKLIRKEDRVLFVCPKMLLTHQQETTVGPHSQCLTFGCVQDVLESWVLNGVIFLMWEEKMCIH